MQRCETLEKLAFARMSKRKSEQCERYVPDFAHCVESPVLCINIVGEASSPLLRQLHLLTLQSEGKIKDMKRTTSGFTIVELLIVIVVIAILAAITVVAYNGITARSQDAQMLSDLTNASKKVELYNAEFSSYPTAQPQVANLRIKFSFSPVGADGIYCGDTSGFAIFIRRGSRQYKVANGIPPAVVSPLLTWTPAAVCASTAYPYVDVATWWVVGG